MYLAGTGRDQISVHRAATKWLRIWSTVVCLPQACQDNYLPHFSLYAYSYSARGD